MTYILIIIAFSFLIWCLGLERLGDKVVPHTKTIRDLLITLLCSFAPIILDSIVQSWFTPVKLADAFYESFEEGEVFLFTSAYLSAFFIFYIKGNKKPPGIIFSIFLISGFTGALLYTFAYSTDYLNLNSYAPSKVITIIEILIVVGVLIVWYWSTLPTNKINGSLARDAQTQQEELKEKFLKAKGP